MFAKSNKIIQEVVAGNRLYEKGKFKKALKHYLNAKRLSKDDFATNMNCANANFMLKKYSKTIYYLEKLKVKNKDNKKVLLLLARACFEAEKYEKAEEYFEELIAAGEENSWNYNWLSQCLQKNGKYEKAIECAWKAVELSEDNDEAHQLNLGYLLYEVKLEDNNINILNICKKWIENYPNNAIAQYLGNSALGNMTEGKKVLAGVKNIFDAFAPEFEKTLADLGYKTPEEIYGVLKKHNVAKTKVLDLGCGTGLCGRYLKHFAGFGKLYGIDISTKMLEEAKRKNIYSELFCEDIISFLRRGKNRFGLIAAADVLTYFSELDAVFAVVCNSLNKGGFFAFSITKSPNNSNIFLHPSGRYAHSLEYIEKLAKKYDFSIIYSVESRLRNENGKPVIGYIFLLQKAYN